MGVNNPAGTDTFIRLHDDSHDLGANIHQSFFNILRLSLKLDSAFLPSSIVQMPICKYFASPTGCSRGDTCYFQHIEPAKSAKPDTIESLTSKQQRYGIKDQDQDSPRAIAAQSDFIGNATTQIPCRFFAFGNCKSGSKCRFSHAPVNERIGHQEDIFPQVGYP